MDIIALSDAVISTLVPVLPYLLKAGEKAAEETGKKIGGEAWERAKELWARLRPKVETKPAAIVAINKAAASPDDADARSALRLQIRKLLTEDNVFATELDHWWNRITPGTSDGERKVVIKRDATSSAIITGDGNIIGSNNRIFKGKP